MPTRGPDSPLHERVTTDPNTINRPDSLLQIKFTKAHSPREKSPTWRVEKKTGSSTRFGHSPPCGATWLIHHIRKSLTLLSSKKLGMPCHFLTKRATQLSSTKKHTLWPFGSVSKTEITTCKLCFFAFLHFANNMSELPAWNKCCVMLRALHTQSALVDAWFPLVPYLQASPQRPIAAVWESTYTCLRDGKQSPALTAIMTKRFFCQKLHLHSHKSCPAASLQPRGLLLEVHQNSRRADIHRSIKMIAFKMMFGKMSATASENYLSELSLCMMKGDGEQLTGTDS